MIALDICLIVFISALVCLLNCSIFLCLKINFPVQSDALANYTAQIMLYPEKVLGNFKNAETKYWRYFQKHDTKFPGLFIKGCKSVPGILML